MPLTQSLARAGLTPGDFEHASCDCPAGDKVHVVSGDPITVDGVRLHTLDLPAVRCKIERNTLTAAHDPSSLALYCLGDYTTCPSWRFAKDREHEARMMGTLDLHRQDLPTRPGHTIVDQELRRRARVA